MLFCQEMDRDGDNLQQSQWMSAATGKCLAVPCGVQVFLRHYFGPREAGKGWKRMEKQMKGIGFPEFHQSLEKDQVTLQVTLQVRSSGESDASRYELFDFYIDQQQELEAREDLWPSKGDGSHGASVSTT